VALDRDLKRMMDFATLIASIAQDSVACRIAIPEDWQQGRTTYGGLAAAICVESARRHFPGLPPLRSAQFSFIGPATGTLTARPQMLRKGKPRLSSRSISAGRRAWLPAQHFALQQHVHRCFTGRRQRHRR
jgi:hypothetical protein